MTTYFLSPKSPVSPRTLHRVREHLSALGVLGVDARIRTTDAGVVLDARGISKHDLDGVLTAFRLRLDAVDFDPTEGFVCSGRFRWTFFGSRDDAKCFTVYDAEGIVGRGEMDLDPVTGAATQVSMTTSTSATAQDVRAAWDVARTTLPQVSR